MKVYFLHRFFQRHVSATFRLITFLVT